MVPTFVRIGGHVVNLARVEEILYDPSAPFGPTMDPVPTAWVRLSSGREVVVTGAQADEVRYLADRLAVAPDALVLPEDEYVPAGDGFVPSQEDLESLGGSDWDDDTPL